MSSRPSAANTYTRSAILAWANAVLQRSHLTFHDIPCHDVALLLFGIFHATDVQIESCVSTNDAVGVPLLSAAELRRHDAVHRVTCRRYLQLLQFPPAVTTTAAAVVGNASSAASVSSAVAASVVASAEDRSGSNAVTQLRNAEHVLALIRALSSEEAEQLRAGNSCSDGPKEQDGDIDAEGAVNTGNAANVVLLLGPSMTANAWLGGNAFVEELKLWRWVRLMADRHRCTVTSIRTTIAAYLQHDVLEPLRAVPPTVSSSSLLSTVCGTAGKRSRSSSPEPTEEQDEGGEKEHAEDSSIGQTHTATGRHADGLNVSENTAEVQQQQRRRLDASQPPVAPLLTSTASTTPFYGSVSPVHALLSPIRGTDRHERDDGESLSCSSTSAAAAALALHEATEATTTSYVAQTLPLQNALRVARSTLECTLRDAATVTAADTEVVSAHSSTGAAENLCDGAGQMSLHPSAPPAVHNNGEAQEVLCRRRMVEHVFPVTAITDGRAQADTRRGSGGSGGGAVPNSSASALTAPSSCCVCPAVMAHAIQCNLNAIDALEEARVKAIAACMKKDPVALLAALQSIV